MDPREELTAALSGLSTKIQDGLVELKAEATSAERKAELGAEVDRWVAEANTKRAELAELEAGAAREADANELKALLAEPQRKLPRGIGANPGTDDYQHAVKELSAAGWENKMGVLHAPTTKGLVEMLPETTLFGPLPDNDSEASNHVKAVRASFSPDYDGLFRKYIRLTAKARNETVALLNMEGVEQKALSEGVDTEGGYLVPPQAMAELQVRRAARAVMRNVATVVPTTKDAITWPAVAPAAAPDGSVYSSGFVGTWGGETPAFTETDPGFQQFVISVKKIRVATKLSIDFVNDADANVLGFLSTNGAENMALTEDYGFINGDGSALQVAGLISKGETTIGAGDGIPKVDVEGTTANTVSNTNADAGSAPKLLDLQYALPDQYEGNARWLLKRATEASVRQLVDGNDRFMWLGGFSQGPPADLLGYPKDNSVWMPDEGTDGNSVLAYGDLSTYIIAQRFGVSVVVLRERFADTDEIGFILWERVGGNLWNTDAIRLGVV